MRTGLSVQITRKDGTKFLASQERGILPPVWTLSHRKLAVEYKRFLQAHGFNASVVSVSFTVPEVVA